MTNPITVNKDLPVTNADILSGTALDPVPGPGMLLVYVASSQRDGIVSVGGPGILGGGSYRIPPVLRSNGVPDLNSDMPTAIAVRQGKVMVDYTEVTGGDAFATVIFVPA